MVNEQEQGALSFAIELAIGQGINVLDRSIQIFEDIDSNTLKKVDYGVSILEKLGSEPITIRIATAGGDVYAGFGIAGRLRASPCKIITEAYGNCMSSGVMVFSAGDVRRAMEPVLFMLHQLSAEIPEDKLLGLKAAVIQLKRDQEVYIKYLAQRTGTATKIWKSIINRSDDTYLTSVEALRLNLATEEAL